MGQQKRRRSKPRKIAPPPAPMVKPGMELSDTQKRLNALSTLFSRVQQSQRALDVRIRNFSEEDLERFLGDVIRYRSQLIDINNHAYMVYGLFRELINFYVTPLLYRWTVNTQVKCGFDSHEQDATEFDRNYVAYAAGINQLNLQREFHRILLKMLLEDAVFGYWMEEDESSVIYYLPSAWCTLNRTTNGAWTYYINAHAPSQKDLDCMPRDLASMIIRHRKSRQAKEPMPVPFQKQVCFKFNDHTSIIFPPFTHVVLLIMNLLRAKDLAQSQMESDAVNLIQMIIPHRTDEDDHLLFTEPIVEKFATGIQDLLGEVNAILPTPMELKVLPVKKNNNVDKSAVSDALNIYHGETGMPKFGGSNTAAEMKRALEFAASKMYVVLDQISFAINLKMKLDGYIFDHYEFVYEILHMTVFNRDDTVDNLLKQSQSGGLVKLKLEAARGNNPAIMLGQAYTENVVYRKVFEALMVPPTSHTQSSGGRPVKDDDNLSEAGVATREAESNDPDNKD